MNNKIGILDSGLGGLSILKKLIKVLPNENYLFYEDSINNPYGNKTDDEIFKIVSNIVDYLLNEKCKIIVIACNTATTACINKLRNKYKNTIFVGTVPAIKVSFDHDFKNTLLIATPYTIKSNSVHELINNFKKDNQNIYLESGCDLAHLIEVNDEEKIDLLLNKLLIPYKNKIDSIVLGCTHYPLIENKIKKILPNCNIIDGAIGVSNEVKHQLINHNLLNNSNKKGTIIIKNSKDKNLINRSYEIIETPQ